MMVEQPATRDQVTGASPPL